MARDFDHVVSSVMVPPPQLPTGVPGLDDVLGGGLPEGSCTAIVGDPGTGKTTLAQQILFTTAASGRSGVYFAGPGESPSKVLSHQQRLSFFDTGQLDHGVYLRRLSHSVVEGDPTRVLAAIAHHIEARQAALVVVDLVQALTPTTLWKDLVFYLTRCPITSILIADCEPLDAPPGGLLSAADSVLWLRQRIRNEVALHTLQAPKVRGQQPLPGLHSIRLTWDGLHVFPRWPLAEEPRVSRARVPARLTSGSDELDGLLGGGIPAADTVLVEGPAGSGKSVLAAQFAAANSQRDEPSVVLLFEERPDRFLDRAEALRLELERLVEGGMVDVLSFRGRDLSADEVIYRARQAVRRLGARCVVIDSTVGLERALSGGLGLGDCLWRLLDTLSGAGVTVWLNGIADELLRALVDDVIQLRRVEREGCVEHELTVLKMRSSSHSREIRAYAVGERGVELAPRDLAEWRDGSNGQIVGGADPLTIKRTA